MQRPLSQLIYAPFQEQLDGPRVVTLHRHNAFADGMRAIGLAVNPAGSVIGLQSSKGVYIGRTIVGYTWFLGSLQKPSPVHFGDALVEIERFLWDEVDRQPGDEAKLPFVVGDEQGGIMALAIAAAAPDLVSGAVAVNAMLPVVPGWEPPLAPLEQLPILLVNPGTGNILSGDAPETAVPAETFERWGGRVTIIDDPSTPVPLDRIRAWIASSPTRTIRT